MTSEKALCRTFVEKDVEMFAVFPEPRILCRAQAAGRAVCVGVAFGDSRQLRTPAFSEIKRLLDPPTPLLSFSDVHATEFTPDTHSNR
jgi:hypothetical protein